MKALCLSLFILLSLIACEGGVGQKSSLLDQIEVGGFSYQLYYLPHAQQARQLSRHDAELSFKEALKRVEGHHYFKLAIQASAGQSIREILNGQYGPQAQQVWNELHFQIQDDFFLTEDHFTAPCKLYHVEQHPFAQQGIQVLLVFQAQDEAMSKPISSDMRLQFEDRWLSKQSLVFNVDNALIAQK